MNTPKDSFSRSPNDALSLPALKGEVSRAKPMKPSTIEYKINDIALRLFNAVLEGDERDAMLIEEYGVFLTSTAAYASEQVRGYLLEASLTGEELNQTFYKSWEKVQSLTLLERLVDQIMHYLTGYGTDFTGPLYIPVDSVELKGKKLPVYVISGLTHDQMIEKAKSMLSSGVALKETTVDDVIHILGLLGYKFGSVDWIKNREALVKVMSKFNLYPEDPVEFLRFVVYKATGETLLIKNQALIVDIQCSSFEAAPLFNDYGLEKLATIFNRFKPIFLAFRRPQSKSPKADQHKINCVINRISKLSKTHHVPMVENPLNVITSRKLSKDDIHWLDNATPYALFRALNVCAVRINADKQDFVYRIRNGKSWTTKNEGGDKTVQCENYYILVDYIRQRMSHLKGMKVFLPDYIDYGLPVSEKQFIGKFPMGTRVIADNLAVGIYWENDFGAHDLDLSGLSLSGKVGWNSHYNLTGLSYSGDITYAPDGAVEYLYATKDVMDTLTLVNCYSGNYSEHSYNVIVGIGDNVTKNFMMNPENLILNERFHSTSRQSVTGIFTKVEGRNTFVMYPICGGSARVSGSNELSTITRNAFIDEAKNSLTVRNILDILNAEIVEKVEEADYNLDPKDMNTSTLINMFSDK